MNNLKIYILTIVISFAFIIPSLLCNSPVMNVLSGIGCSGVAAAILAIFLEIANNKRENRKAEKAKALYLERLYDQLIITIEKILWFNERLTDDSFNWDLSEEVYSTMNYMVAMSTQYPTSTLSFDEAKERLIGIGERYNHENIKTLESNEVHRINRLFQIVAAGSSHLIMEANAVKENQLILEIEDYLSIEDNKKLMFDISLAFALMPKTDKNYKVVIECLMNATEKLREIGKYTNDVYIGLHGSVLLREM